MKGTPADGTDGHEAAMRAATEGADGTDPLTVRAFARFMEHGLTAVALTHGPEHTLAYANLAFRRLVAVGAADVGQPIIDAMPGRETSGLAAVLDRVFLTGVVSRDNSIAALGGRASPWQYSVWPESSADGGSRHLVIQMEEPSKAELTHALQREVAERMLLSSLRERDATSSAERSGHRATFLAAEGRRLAESLDETATRDALTRLTLPALSAWCIIDVLDEKDVMHRLRIVHPDAAKQALLRDLEGRWAPEPADLFGLPAVLRNRQSTVITGQQVDAAVVTGAHDVETLRVLRAIGFGALLTVPLVVRGLLLGAVTFVTHQADQGFSRETVALAEDLAARSAMALDSATMHSAALELKTIAETASQAKSAFLGTMSHELRTPLNAIGGYVDLIDIGVHGPVSDAQRIDLGRIRSNQRHLLMLITDLLNFVRVGSGSIAYEIGDVIAREVIGSTVSLIDALIAQKGLSYDLGDCDPGLVARADSEKVQQILINLFSNAIKFTPSGGRITVDCQSTENTVLIRVTDTGIGIPAEKLEAIFDPFVQVKEGFAGRDTGVGLGLAISRDLARAMKGELRVESELGRGSRFTLALPKAV